MGPSQAEVRPVDVRVTASDPRESPGVLVVDDFADGRDVLVEFLRYCGFAVYGASGGAEAIEMALTLRPKVILMDLAMPGIDGVEATRRLKADDRTKDIIVIALTARAMAADEHAARAVGCDGFIPKPCDLSSLVAVLTQTTGHECQPS